MPTTRTQCPYCGVGCGLLADTDGRRLRAVRGDPLHPVNRGRTCRKPLELSSAVHASDRATTPLLRDADGRLAPAGWEEAYARVAGGMRDLAAQHGPEAIAFYISGQLLTEDYYAVNKLAKGFLGTNNVDSNSRLCMSSAVAGYTQSLGADGPPPAYADLALTDCLLLLGTNTAACHPIVWSRIRDRQAEGAFVICADPRATPTATGADLHLPVRPGTDLALLSAMLHVIDRDGLVDTAFVERHTTGWEEARGVAAQWPPQRAAEVCGVPAADIETAARRFAGAAGAMALWSMGANQSTVGTLKNRALINLCLAAGQIGRPGAGPLSLTGQPNAMGGRETGGLAHMLPGYRKVAEAPDRAAMEAHWGLAEGSISPQPGLPAVELFDALEDGRVKAVWIMATNPLVSLPDGLRARRALERAELVVVSDAHHPTETSTHADVVLPAAAWPEKQGAMTNSERRVALVRRALPPPGAARPDWEIVAGVARHLGHGDAFAWPDAAAVFAEFAATTAATPCDQSGMSHERLLREGSLQWPCPGRIRDHPGTQRLYTRLQFATPDGRARFAPTPHADPAEVPDAAFPLLLTTGRVADQWHTMTRTGHSPTLRAAAGRPEVACHPADAQAAGLDGGRAVRVVSRRGETRLTLRCDETLPRGVAFAPFHWGDLHAEPGAGSLNALTIGATDPDSGQPELKAVAVRLERVAQPDTPVRRSAPPRPRRLVVVGAGMAGLAVAEEALRRRPGEHWRISMLGEEGGLPYNRILLSKLLARTCGAAELELRPAAWFAEHGVALHGPAGAIDTAAREVTDADGQRHPYDALVLATGSRPFVPPVPGTELPHVGAFRTRRDADHLAATPPGTRVVVIGGGLLGLEAAAGLRARGAAVTVVELAGHLMAQQLEAGGGAMLARGLGAQGIALRLGRAAAQIEPGRVVLDDGDELEAGAVVMAAGVRPQVALARAAGLACDRGILVDDELRTSAPDVWAVGECAEHRGTVYGLWAPVAEQARVAGARIAGDPAGFHGAITATTLKVSGVGVFAGGASTGPLPDGAEEILVSDTRAGVHRRLVLEDGRLVGVSLVGDTTDARRLSGLLRDGLDVPEELLLPGAGDAAGEPDPAETICSCNAVTRGELERAIASRGLRTVAQVGRVTRATTGCGGCTEEVESILASRSRNTADAAGKPQPSRMGA
ncbi:MAG: molybdopterin-dependent oxidoreductase [Solirubrobacteraceae bacterium MAG38_C4-C5]|nr:molybdopterin-dependent oxidoreductase [Candidatus Siliceabacter maunaloa]